VIFTKSVDGSPLAHKTTNSSRYEFDDVVVDSDGFRVLKGGEARPLTPRAFDVLLFLIEQRDRVVEKRELFDQFWSGSFVTDNALTRVIKEIRQAIGDDANAPRHIETIPKRGYRFIGQTLAAAGQSFRAAANSIAVMPLINAGASPDAEYLSDGITTSIINILSQLSTVRVLARSTVFSYKGRQDVAPQVIGKELNVSTLLTGKVAQLSDKLVISAELVNTADGTQRWGQQYTRELSDVLDIQEEISREISENLQLRLSEKDHERLVKRDTGDAEAYRLYLQGYYSLYKFTPEGLVRSFDYFNQAIEKDPNYALAYAGLVEAYFNLSFIESPAEVWTRAKEAALRALQLDGRLAEAHYAMALVSLCYDRDLRTAEREFKRAIELRPNYPLAHDWYGLFVLGISGRFDEAFTELRKARDLDPLSLAINTDFATCLYWAGQYDQAIEEFKNVLDLESNFYIAHLFLGLTYLRIGQLTAAIEEFTMAQAQSNNPVTTGYLGFGLATAGREREARQILDELEQQFLNGYVPPDSLAVVYIGLGEKQQAFEWLRKACDKRTVVSLTMRVDPVFDSLRGDREFADLLLRAGLEP
jgi:TolB-like protein/Tfp pilus assembly protein PilF